MRIGINCHTLYHPMTGVQKSIKGLVNSLAENNSGNEICAYIPSRFPENILQGNISYLKSWIFSGNRTLRIMWEQFFLHKRVFDDKLDVLHCPCYIMPLWCLKPVVLTVHDVFALTNPEFCTKTNYTHFRKMLPKSVQRAKTVVVPTNAVKRDLLDNIEGVSADKVDVVPWGVDKKYREEISAQKKEEVRRKYGLPPRYVLHVGRMEPKKNIVQLVEAFFSATVVRKLPHRLVLAGPGGWGVKNLDRVINELGISEKVYKIGYVAEDDMPALYSMADVFCFPSLAEGFGLPVLEAMSVGTPVLTSDIMALKEVSGGNASYAKKDSLPSLREKLEEILTDNILAHGLALKAKEYAKTFTWEKHTEKMLKIYEKSCLE